MENDNEVLVKKLTPSNGAKSSGKEREIVRKASSSRSRSNRPRETEEEAMIRRLHDAQRMARFRARKKKALEDQQQQQQQQQLAGDAKHLNDRKAAQDESDPERQQTEKQSDGAGLPETESKYTQLLAIIERLGRDVRLSYAGSRSSAERLKSGIVRARTLVRDCLIETRLNLRQ